MKTLFFYVIHIYLFCVCTCLFGIPQPRPKFDNVSKPFNGDNIIKKCQGVNGDLRASNYLDEDVLLCFGLRVFSQQLGAKVEVGALLGRVEKQSNADICKHFQEMKLISSLEKVNDSVVLYNRQFRDENSCQRSCLDVVDNVNPLCSIILLLSRDSKANPNGSGAQTDSSTQPDGKADDDNNEVSNVNPVADQSVVPNSVPDEQQIKASDVNRVTAEENTEISAPEKIFKPLKLVSNGGKNKSLVPNIQSRLPEQSTQGVKSTLADERKDGQQQQADETVIDLDKEKPKATIQEKPLVSEQAKGEVATNGIQEGKNHITPNINTENDISNKTAISNNEHTETTVESISSVTKTEKQGKLTSLTEVNIPDHSSVNIPLSSSDDKKEQAASTGPKLQENFSAGQDGAASKKEGADPGPLKEESSPQVKNVEEGKVIDNSQKSQADNKETENPPLKDVGVQINSKTITEEIPKSNIDEPKTSQKNGKEYTNEDAETVPQSGRDDTQKTVSEEMHFADDTGDGVAELDTHFSLEAGESNDNTEFTSGGGTGIDYARPGSDVLETDKTDMDAALMFHEKFGEDDSHFFAYFMTTMVFCIVGYLVFHNKQKILALALEGRARRGRRRPNTSGYRKLDSNLEEAISSSKSASVTQVIY